MRKFLISTSGFYLLRDNIQQRAPMMRFFRVQSSLNLMRESGNPRLPPNANFSCGWSLIIDAGQRTDWQRGGSLIQISAFCVIKRRTFNIFLWAVYFQETFGSPSCRALVLQHLLLNLLTNPSMIGGEKSTVLLVEIIGWPVGSEFSSHFGSLEHLAA